MEQVLRRGEEGLWFVTDVRPTELRQADPAAPKQANRLRRVFRRKGGTERLAGFFLAHAFGCWEDDERSTIAVRVVRHALDGIGRCRRPRSRLFMTRVHVSTGLSPSTRPMMVMSPS